MPNRLTPPDTSDLQEHVLEGWKAIAAYLNRDVRTAKRWEGSEGLPIHRHRHLARSSVYAHPRELDAWRLNRRPDQKTPPQTLFGKRQRMLMLAPLAIAALITTGGGRAAGPARLTAERQNVVDAQVWAEDFFNLDGRPSPDGRYMPFPNYRAGRSGGGNLAVHDLVTNQDRDLTHATDMSFAESPFFATDGKRVIYNWWDQPTDTWSIRVINADGSGLRRILDNETMRGPGATSPDGRTLAVSIRQNSAQQIVLVDLESGQRKTLRSLDWREPQIGNFSPDGRYLVYSALARQDQVGRDVLAIAIDGSAQITLASAPAENRMPFFTPDGRDVVFVSNRSGGRWDLWSVGFVGGKVSENPQLLKIGIGPVTPRSFAADGTLFYGKAVDQHNGYEADVDPATWRLVGSPRRVSDRYVGVSGAPKWSPDGTTLAYAVRRGSSGRYQEGDLSFILRDRQSGSEREVPVEGVSIAAASFFRWFPDKKSLLLVDYAAAGRSFRRLDLTTGQIKTLFEAKQSALAAIVSNDGRYVFYPITDLQDRTLKHLIRRELDSGVETTVLSARTGGDGSAAFAALSGSPDGRSFAYVGIGPQSGSRAVWVGALAGGEPRELWRPSEGGVWPQHLAWTPDSAGVLATVAYENQSRAIWYVPVHGGQAVTTGIAMPNATVSGTDPNGHRIDFTAGQGAEQLWALKNVLTPLSSAK